MIKTISRGADLAAASLLAISASTAFAQVAPVTSSAKARQASPPDLASSPSQTTTPSPGTAVDQASTTASGSSTQLQEIVVTAQKRRENLQRVPISVTAISGAALKDRAIENLTQLSTSIPGFQVQEFSGVLLPFIRGIGNSSVAIGNEPSVALYLDGIYFSRLPSTFFQLRNVERVEVLKGPQGTLFGRNSTGGVINILTRDPSYELRASGSIGYGNFNAVDGDIYISSKIANKVAADISVVAHTDDGFGKNLTTGHRFGYADSVLARSKLLFEATDTTRFVVSGFYSWSRQSGLKGAFPGTAQTSTSDPTITERSTPDLGNIPNAVTGDVFGYFNTLSNIDTSDTFRLWGTSLRAEQELSFARLTSITAYSHLAETDNLDVDYGPTRDRYALLVGQVTQFSQELQLASLSASKLTWILGLYYYNSKSLYDTVNFSGFQFPIPISAPARQKVLSLAGFAQATYEILPRLKLTGGIRYTSDKESASGETFLLLNPPINVVPLPEGKKTVNRVTFKASADYQVNEHALLYTLFSRGFKSGNFNILTYNSTSPTDPENIDAYEAGFKLNLLARRVRLNGAAFYYKVGNPQVQLIRNATILYSNAGGSRVKGLELEAEALVAEGFTVRASGTYLDSKYTSYGRLDANGVLQDGAPTSTPLPRGGAILGPPIDAAGRQTPLASKVTFDIGADYKWKTSIGEILLSADLYHNSGYFYEPDNFLRQDSFDILNSEIRYKPTEHTAIRIWGKNLLATQYSIAANTQGGSPGYPWIPAAPRTYGISAEFDF